MRFKFTSGGREFIANVTEKDVWTLSIEVLLGSTRRSIETSSTLRLLEAIQTFESMAMGLAESCMFAPCAEPTHHTGGGTPDGQKHVSSAAIMPRS